MTTLAAALANASQRWTVVLRIEGVGHGLSSADLTAANSDARTRFCSYPPSFAADEPATLWRPLFDTLPTLLSERADPLGGRTENGAITWSMVDVDDYLTQLLRTDRPPVTAVSVAMTTSATAVSLLDTTGLSADDAIWVGGEAMRIVSVDSGTTLTVSRGYLGTSASAHDVDDRVFVGTPILETRQVQAALLPIDADSWADAYDLGTYSIDSVDWDSDANVWELSASAQNAYLDRLVPSDPAVYRAVTVDERDVADPHIQLAGVPTPWQPPPVDDVQWSGTEADSSVATYMAVGSEVIGIGNATGRLSGLRRDITGAGQVDLKPGDTWRRVFVAGDNPGSFRYSPGGSPSTSRSSGTWVRTSHWVPISLIIMTSAHGYRDAELSNYNATWGNFSSLPARYGLGLPHTLIDWASWFEVWQRTLDYEFPTFTFGLKTEPFAELITREFLTPMGAFLSVVSGQARLVLPRTPLADSASVSLGSADILTRDVGPGLLSPRMTVSRGTAQLVSELVYELGPGDPVKATLNDAGYRDTFGQRGVFAAGGKSLSIPVPGARKTDRALFGRRGVARLWRAHRPRQGVNLDLAFNTASSAWDVGDLASITVGGVVNMQTATRGWDGVQAQLLERTLVAESDGPGVYLTAKAQVYGGDVRVGRIAPAAHVTGSAGAVATCTANRYTQADALGGLPVTDVGAFTVGDVVTLCDAAGVPIGAAGTETVVDIDEGASEIEFSGDFNGELGADVIVRYAVAGSASTTQRNRYAFMGGRSAQEVAGSGDPLWVYGE